MIKTGIYDITQLARPARLKSLFGKDRVISVTLYDQILDLPNADALAERILLLFSDERGAYKRTYANRFEEFDVQFLRLLTEQYDPQDPLVLADVGVSDGRTACDLFERIATHYPRISYYASDYGPQVFVLRQGRLTVTLSRNYCILEIVWPPFVFTTMKPENPLYYPLNHTMRFLVRRLLAQPLIGEYLAGRVEARELLLFSVRALNLSKKDGRFHLGEQNILEPLVPPEPPNIVRAMNVLNASYFGASDLDQIVWNIYNTLRQGGWLVTGSNQDAGSIVHGGIYRKTSTGFDRVWQSGNGPQVESHILSWKPPAA
jgi:hypothetical protein